MLKIYPVKTNEDVEIAKKLFTKYAEFLKEELSEYADLCPGSFGTIRTLRKKQRICLTDIGRRRGRYCSLCMIISQPGVLRWESSARGHAR